MTSSRFGTHVHEAHARGLREHRWRRTRVAEVDAVRVQRFEQLRTGQKFKPLHAVAKRLELLLQRALYLEDCEQTGFLIADAQDFLGFTGSILSERAAGGKQRRRSDHSACGERGECAKRGGDRCSQTRAAARVACPSTTLHACGQGSGRARPSPTGVRVGSYADAAGRMLLLRSTD